MAVSCAVSSRKPSWPNFEWMTWKSAPGMASAIGRIEWGGKMQSLSMATTVEAARMRASAASTPPRPRPTLALSTLKERVQ